MRSQLATSFALIVIALLLLASVLFAWMKNADTMLPVQFSQTGSCCKLPNRAGEVRFSHDRHGAAVCMDCHHKIGDANPYQSCHVCHQADGRAPGIRQAMHQVCTACHTQAAQAGKSAPSRRCSSCHAKGY